MPGSEDYAPSLSPRVVNLGSQLLLGVSFHDLLNFVYALAAQKLLLLGVRFHDLLNFVSALAALLRLGRTT